MHRSNFRAKRETVPLRERPQQVSSPVNHDFAAIREEIASLGARLDPLKASVECLAAPKPDIAVPGDIAKSLNLIHGRLDRLERQQKAQDEQQKRAETAFSNAILKMADKLEKIAGGEDSEFSLAHSLEKLINVLSSRRLRIHRDADGNMSELENITGEG